MYDHIEKLVQLIMARDGLTENQAYEKAYEILESDYGRS